LKSFILPRSVFAVCSMTYFSLVYGGDVEETTAAKSNTSVVKVGIIAKLALAVPSKAIKNQYIVLLKKSTSNQSFQNKMQSSMALSQKLGGKIITQFSKAIEGYVLSLDAAQIPLLRNDPNILLIEQDQKMVANTVQNTATWGIDRIDQVNLPLSGTYDYTQDGTGGHAYIIDTGIDISHTDFGGRAVSGWDYVDNDSDASDCNGHGTHVAGIVGSATWGVAKNVRLTAVRVLNCFGSGTTSGVVSGIDWVINHAIFPAVANMSLGGGDSVALDTAVDNAIQAGITFAVAAGNDNSDACVGSPNKVPAAITVGSSTSVDTRSSFSNWGSCIDIFAPGSSITSTWLSGGTATISGTSMASPHVAGAAALYLQLHPTATPAQVTSALVDHANPDHISDLTGSPNLLLNMEFVKSSSPETCFPIKNKQEKINILCI